MVAWAEEQLSLGVALGWLQEVLVEEPCRSSFPADGYRRWCCSKNASPGELGHTASPAASISSSSSSCFAAFLVAPAVANAATSAPLAVATVASKPSASGEKLCHTVKQSDADLQTLRHNCENTTHFSAVVLANRFSCQIMDALTIVCRPMHEASNMMRTTSERGNVRWIGAATCLTARSRRQSWAHGLLLSR